MSRSNRAFFRALWGLAVAASVLYAVPAGATLTLTPAGIADGFTLTTFATIAPRNTGCCEGPFGVAVSVSRALHSSVAGAGPDRAGALSLEANDGGRRTAAVCVSR